MDNYGFLYRYCENIVDLPTPIADKKALIRCLYVVGLFSNDRFEEAAQQLVSISYASFEDELRKIFTPADYAYYLTMTSLATFSRTALKKIEENQAIKGILESAPELSTIISAFLSSQYTEVFARLATAKSANRFSTFFLSKIDTLIRMIVEKAIVQYCLPYKSVDLRIMAKALGEELGNLEDKLVGMSSAGLIKAKIDSQNKVLC